MSASRLEGLKEFLDTCQGTSWYRVNLHVHASGQDPDVIVDEAIKAGISLIAITDHNNFRFVKPVQEAASKRTDADLIVLPGIEITLEEGAHIIALFDYDFGEDKQKHFLGRVNLPVDGSVHDAVKDKTCSEVLTDITDAQGITLVPHPYSNDIGFLDRARKISTKMDWLESGNIGLIQIDEEKVKYIGFDDSGKWQNRYVLSSSPPSVVSASDYCLAPMVPGEAKNPAEIENGAVWLKLGSRTVRGLRQVTCEPRTCMSSTPPSDAKTYKLLGLTVQGGFFDGLNIGFSPDFTCIIGENHSGKTAIFDFISFALGRDLSVLSTVDRKEELEILLRRLDAILQPGGSVNLFLSQNNHSYCISRIFIPEYDDKTSAVKSILSSPEALEYDPAKDQLVPIDFTEIAVLPEIYTQGHVGVLRRSVKALLALIDDLAGLSGYRKDREEITELLLANAEELAGLYEEREELVGVVGNLGKLKEELNEKEQYLKASGHTLWKATATLIKNIKYKIKAIEESLGPKEKMALEQKWKISRLEYEEKDVVLPDILTSISGVVDTYNSSIDSAISKLEEAVGNLKKECSPFFDDWDEKYAAHKEMVSKTLRKQGFDSPEQLLSRVDTLGDEINKIEKEEAPKLAAVVTEINAITKIRNQYLEKFKKASKIIAENRKSEIKELNEIVGVDISISLEEPDPTAYFELLKEVCTEIASKDRKIQKRDEQLFLVTMMVKPYELVEAISNEGIFENNEGQKISLVEACEITQNTQDVLCAIKGQIGSLHKLQVFEPEPVPKISVRREGTDNFADLITGLSPGEQSSTILTLALMAREVPLIIDQPEDELGYSYIVNKIVPKILDAKKERQVLLISHNANIPVLADAEYLVKIRNDPIESESRCTIEDAGTFAKETMCDKLLELEGGERAFQIRQRAYAVNSTTY